MTNKMIVIRERIGHLPDRNGIIEEGNMNLANKYTRHLDVYRSIGVEGGWTLPRYIWHSR